MKPLFFTAFLALTSCAPAPLIYDIKDSVETTSASSDRIIEYRSLEPENCEDCPFIFFSHGANAAYDRYDALLIPLAKNGFHIVIPNHTDSEEHKTRDQYSLPQSLPTRLEDYELLLKKYAPESHFVIGHSYGAMIAQLTAGGTLSGPSNKYQVDPSLRPKSIIAISPPGPIPNYIEADGWSHVTQPSLIVTGTTDIVLGMTENWEDHLVSYDVAPSGSYAIIYDKMDHYMNGAYGRENQNTTIERQNAISHLVSVVTNFMTAPNRVPTLQEDFVEIRER